MDQIWIGSFKANGVSGKVGIGLTCSFGDTVNSKSNTGNGVVSGDFAQIPVYMSLVNDPDWLDAPIWKVVYGSPNR